jgi:hypothetical protein
VFNTTDGFALDVFVVDGWSSEVRTDAAGAYAAAAATAGAGAEGGCCVAVWSNSIHKMAVWVWSMQQQHAGQQHGIDVLYLSALSVSVRSCAVFFM